MSTTQRTARLAGLLYLASAIAAGGAILTTAGLITDGDPAATARHILAGEPLVRLGIIGELLGALLLVATVRTLRRLFAPVNASWAALMVTTVLLSVPISCVNVITEIAALTLMRGATYLAVFDAPHRDAAALLLLDLHGTGVAVVNIFWGLWLVPFGLLVWRSRMLPRLLGALLLVNAAALVTVSLTSLALPAYADRVSRCATLPELGELWAMLWLLIAGAKSGSSGTNAARPSGT